MIYTSNLVVGLERGLDDPAFLKRAADETGTGVELFLHVHDTAYQEKMETAAQWLGNRPRTTHGPFIGVEAASPRGSKEHEHFLAAYRYAFQMARSLNSPHMVFHTHQRVIQAHERDEARQMCMESIQELLDLSARYGVQLLIENLDFQKKGVSLFDEDAFLELLERFPQAGCLIDVGHLHVAGWNAERVLKALGKRVEGFHFHNNDGRDDTHCRITDGTLDYTEVMRLYRRYTPNADITLEYGDNHGITCDDVIEDLRTIQGMLA